MKVKKAGLTKMQKNTLFGISLFAINIGIIITQNVCESADWALYNNNCYKIFWKAYGNKRQGSEAQKACISEGANLLKIDDINEYNWMKTFMTSNSYSGSEIWVHNSYFIISKFLNFL